MQLAGFLFPQYFDNNGNPLSGGKIYAYAADTVTPQDTYSNAAGTALNTNPITLSSSGRTKIFLQALPYDFVIKSSTGVTIDTISGVGASGQGGLSSVDSIAALRALASGAFNYVEVGGFSSPGDGGGGLFYWSASSTAAQDYGIVIQPSANPATGRWIRLYSGPVNVKWFGAKGDGATSDVSAVNTAIAAMPSTGGDLYLPVGSYFLASSVLLGSASKPIRVLYATGAKFTSSSAVTVTHYTQFTASDSTQTLFAGSATAAFSVFRPLLRPQWFGAKGDGTTDDSSAINAMFNAIRTNGGIAYFPKQTYVVAYGFHVPQNTTIYLNGCTFMANTTFGQGVIPAGGTTRAMLWMGYSLTSGAVMPADYGNISIIGDNAILNGNALNQVGIVGVQIPGYGGLGIETTPAPIQANLFKVVNILVKDVTVTHVVWYGVNIEGPSNVLFSNVRSLYSGANGISVKSGRNITFNKCEASFTRGPNTLDSGYGGGFWHEPNPPNTWQVMENIVHIDCFASYNYRMGYQLWNPGSDCGAEIYAIRCKSYRNSWDTATQAYWSAVDNSGFHVNVPTGYSQRYHIEITDCTALEEFQSGFKVQRGAGSQPQALVRISNCTAHHCVQDDADGYERAAFSVVGSGAAPASATRVEIDNPTIIAPSTNTAGYSLGVLYTQDVFVTNPNYRGPATYNGVFGNAPTNRFTSGVPNAAVDVGSDNDNGIIGGLTKFYKAVRLASFDQTAEPTEILTNEIVVWQNDNEVFKGIYINDDGLKRYVPMVDGIGSANQLFKTNATADGWKPSAVTIDENNVFDNVERININGAVDNVSTQVSCIGNIGAKSGTISAYGVGGPGETNHERILFIHDGVTADVRSLANGTGVARVLKLMVGTTTGLTAQTNGDITLGRNLLFASTAVGPNLFSGCLTRSGTGSPETVVTAPIGSIYLRSDGGAGTSFYVKESGAAATGWVAK